MEKARMNTTDNMQDRVAPVATTYHKALDYIAKLWEAETKEGGKKFKDEYTRIQMAQGLAEWNDALKTVSQQGEPVVLDPITYISLVTGEIYLLPSKKAKPGDINLRLLIEEQGGLIKSQYNLLDIKFKAINSDTFSLKFFENGLLLLECIYTESPKRGKNDWKYSFSNSPKGMVSKSLPEPWLANLTHHFANDWRKIGRFEREQIASRQPEENMANRSKMRRNFRYLCLITCKFEKHFRRDLMTNVVMATKLAKVKQHNQQEIEQLRKELFAKDEQIKVLEATNSKLVAKTEQIVAANS